jgi:hypothetical protein
MPIFFLLVYTNHRTDCMNTASDHEEKFMQIVVPGDARRTCRLVVQHLDPAVCTGVRGLNPGVPTSRLRTSNVSESGGCW